MAVSDAPRFPSFSTPATPPNRDLSFKTQTTQQQSQPAQQQQEQQRRQQHPQAPPLPLPETFDVLPQLHTLLNRLLINKPLEAYGAPSSSATTVDPDMQPLDIQQLPAASGALMVRLSKARQACARLGDMDRTVAEQEEEIEELLQQQEAMLAQLKNMGVGCDDGLVTDEMAM